MDDDHATTEPRIGQSKSRAWVLVTFTLVPDRPLLAFGAYITERARRTPYSAA